MFDLVASGEKKKMQKYTTDFSVMLMLQYALISQNTVVTCMSSGDDIYAYPPSLMQHFALLQLKMIVVKTFLGVFNDLCKGKQHAMTHPAF